MDKWRFLKSFIFAFRGICYVYRHERNMVIHSIFAFFSIVLSIVLSITKIEFMIIVLTCTLVIVLEMINTAVEKVVDLITPTYHPLAAHAKDISAGAVLIVAIASIIIGLLIFGPYLLKI